MKFCDNGRKRKGGEKEWWQRKFVSVVLRNSQATSISSIKRETSPAPRWLVAERRKKGKSNPIDLRLTLDDSTIEIA